MPIAAARVVPVNRDSQMRDVPERMAERLIVALDVPTVAEAQKLVGLLDGVVSFYKIGLGLFVKPGVDQLIDSLIKRRKNVFLDYKMFDIPETVRKGVESAKERGIKFVTVHGDREIIEAAVQGKGQSKFLKIFTITVLTSMNDNDLRAMGYRWTVKELVEHRVKDAIEYGSDGIIASAADKPNDIRRLVDNQRLLIATPGIRPPGSSADDQKRIATPAEAIQAGADYIIVGRPIIAQPNPRQRAETIIRDMEQGAA